MAKKTLSNQPNEGRRFEVLLEEIRSQLRLIAEAQSASVTRDEALDAKIDKMHKDFYNLVENVHADLQERIGSVEKRLEDQIGSVEKRLQDQIDGLREEILEVKEILIAHDKRIISLEHI